MLGVMVYCTRSNEYMRSFETNSNTGEGKPYGRESWKKSRALMWEGRDQEFYEKIR